MGDDVFTRMPTDQLIQFANHGVNGAKKELDRRRKLSLQSPTTELIIQPSSDRDQDLIEVKIYEGEPLTKTIPLKTEIYNEELFPYEESNSILEELHKLAPTNEQQNILNAKGRIVKINARAGTGKTATLLMIAQRNIDKKIIYLVFNKRNQLEAEGKFPGNVKIRTIHSFARSALGVKIDGNKSVHPSLYFKHFKTNKETLATLTSDFIVFFINSIDSKPDDAIDPFKSKLSDELRGIFTQSQSDIVEISRSSLNSWFLNKKDWPHDFYLKMSHLEKKFQSELAKYELVLVDEGQDLSPIMSDALSTYKGRIIIVGDSHQQIYSFRYAENAMQKFNHDELHELTLSFRFGKEIATLTRKFITAGKGDVSFTIFGNPGNKSSVYFYDQLSAVENQPGTAILCRTNFSLFKNAMFLKARGQKFCFGRDITSELHKTLNVYWLSTDEKVKIKDDLIKSFKSLKELEEYATVINDFQLLKIIELVNVYKKEFPWIVFEFLKRCEEKNGNRDSQAITLSTIHAVKGQEYDNVIIDEDVISKLEGTNNQRSSNYHEEVNIVYVGITRAKKNLYLPVGMRQLFTREWQDYTSTIPIISAANSHPISVRPKMYSPLMKNSHRDKKIKSRTAIPKLKVGDTVLTSSGYGRILEINGDRYLIAMENKKTRVWKSSATFVKVQKLRSHKKYRW